MTLERAEAAWRPSSGNAIKTGQYVQELLAAVLRLAPLAVVQSPGHSKPSSPAVKGNRPADTSAGKAASQA